MMQNACKNSAYAKQQKQPVESEGLKRVKTGHVKTNFIYNLKFYGTNNLD